MKRRTLKKILMVLLSVLLLLPSWSFAASSNQLDTLTQPTFKEVSVHDPSVIKVDDYYYVFGSHLAAAKTKDFMHWEMVASGVDSKNSLFNDVIEDLEEAFDWATKISLWAPDVIQLDDGKFYMYYNAAEGSSPRSALGIAVADHIEGPYEDLGIILKSGMWGETSEDGTIYDATKHPNVIDPHTFFDHEGKLWMVYGSYSGGIFILEMDPETGLPLEGQGYGTKLIGGNHSRIEAPYIQYDPETEYYYLYLTFGGLDSVGGYNMRVARSKNPDGPYVDTEGNDMINVKGKDGTMFDDASIAPYGVKLMGNYLFERKLGEPGTGIGTGYVSPGHNSVYYDEDTGKQYLIFHTRFPQRGEAHEIRVHQIFMNEDGWPVIAPYRYTGEELTKVNEADLVGDYKFVNHGKEITADIKNSIQISLNADGTITGLEGTWELKNNYDIELNIDGDIYKGVVVEQWNPTSASYVLTFTALSNSGVSIWGSKNDLSHMSDEDIVNAVIDDINLGDITAVVADLALPTDGARQTEITWQSSDPSVITDTGKVTRPDGKNPVTVTLTATAVLGSEQSSKDFEVTVIPFQEAELVAHYAFENDLQEYDGRLASGINVGTTLLENGGDISFTEGVNGQAVVFDGETGIRLPDGLISNYSYTVSIWLQPEQLTDFTTTFFGARDEDNWLSLVPKGPVDSNTMVWARSENWYDAPSGMTIPTGDWTHLAFTVDYGIMDLYINGEKMFSGTAFPNVFTTSDNVFSLGVNYWDVPYKGLMDELKVYQGVLSEEEIVNEYNKYVPTQPEPPQKTGLVAHYAFENDLNEAEGRQSAGIETGNRLDNEGGTITFTESKEGLGQAAVFDGSSGVRLPNDLITSNKYSVSLWLNPDELTMHTTSFFGAMTTDSWISLLPGGNSASIDTMLWSGTNWFDAVSGMTIPVGEWSHVAFTVNEGKVDIYINGELQATHEGFPNIFTGLNSVFGLGVNYWDDPYKGLMDDLLVYNNYVLSEEQIKNYYDHGVIPEVENNDPEPPQKTGLVAHYAFEGDLSEAADRQVAGKATGDKLDNEGGTITFTEGKEGLGQAAVFDGASGVRLPNDLITSNQYSVSLWLHPDELNVHTTSFFGAMTVDSWISLLPGGNNASPEQLMVWSGSDLGTGWYDATTGMTIPLGEWSHVAFTVDDGKLDIYINGEHQATHEGFPNIFTGTNSVFALGVNYWDVPYKGLMDELLVYNNYVLTEEQIKNYYEHGEIPEEEDPVIDTSELEALIAEAKSFINDEIQYTKDSLAALNEALKEAEKALPSIDSEDELTSIIEKLQVAIDGLEIVPDDEDDPGKDPVPGDENDSGKDPDPVEDDDSDKKPEPGEEDDSDKKPEEPTKSWIIIGDFGEAIDVHEIDMVIVQVDGMNTNILMPDNLPEDAKIIFEDARERPEAIEAENLLVAGDVLDISILGLDYDKIEGTFVLTMSYDKDKYEADEVDIYYYDENQGIWVKQNGTVDAEAGTITVEVDHFSMYGVFAESTPEIEETDDEGAEDPTIEEADTDEEGKVIPKTATAMYNYLFIGIVLVVAGVAFLYVTRRENKIS